LVEGPEDGKPTLRRSAASSAGPDRRTIASSTGEDDIGSIILAIGMGLIDDAELWMESFTDSFEVANKLSELLMLRENREVCCTEDDAGCQLRRWTEQLETEEAAQ
jgi:hypothetical protein